MLTARRRNGRAPNLSDTANGAPGTERAACNAEEEAEDVCVCEKDRNTDARTEERKKKSSMCKCWYEHDQRMHLSAGGESRLNACKVCECV